MRLCRFAGIEVVENNYFNVDAMEFQFDHITDTDIQNRIDKAIADTGLDYPTVSISLSIDRNKAQISVYVFDWDEDIQVCDIQLTEQEREKLFNLYVRGFRRCLQASVSSLQQEQK